LWIIPLAWKHNRLPGFEGHFSQAEPAIILTLARSY
jgi:hypothetical protein